MKSFPALLFLILCLSCFTVHAQDGRLPAPVSVTIDSYKSIQELPQPSWVIKEGDTPLSIQDILNGDIKDGEVLKVRPDEKVIKHFEKYWFPIEFKSQVDLHNWLLHVENFPYSGFGWNNNFSEIQSYGVQDGSLISSGITGYFVPASKRDFKSRHTQSLLNLNLSSGSTLTLWVHISKNYLITSSFPQLTIYDPFVAFPGLPLGGDGSFWLGIFLVTWILSLVIYLYLRDRTSMWFVIFVTALFVDTLSNIPTDPLTSLLYPENPVNGLYVGLGTSVLMMVFLLQFARVFIDLPIKYRKLDKVMYPSVWFFLFSHIVLFYLFFYYKNSDFTTVFMIIYGITFLGSGIIYVFLKDSLSKIIGLALLLFVIPNLIPLPFGENYIIVGLLLTVTIGVGYRIKMLFQERIHAEKEKKELLLHQNTLLEKQVADRTAELSNSLTDLKATQSQLVQQEKLASLGQLTAGIAHEIKNPLNFVNNFSEVSIEIIGETLEEFEKREERDETLIRENLEDIKSNLQKVHEHGSRANGIVTSMLQHSRGGSGQKEPTDLNALIQEYVNLSFHGMRAGKNPIDVEIILDLDPEVKEVSLVKEDFTRVVINLCNNAFDAMREKVLKTQDTRHKTQDGDSGNVRYNPKLMVSTMLEKGRVRISLEDNGPGIPDDIKDKILQPFFTTKKGTEGTGLGLSITHDIVKAHGGELEIESYVNKGTKFIINLSK
ncbi:ATP-binding protein [Aquiflexum sp. TKW24L]|uniref:ATP-binding protein n=1 Tax=Aquiflexum sp. TKW24L TaxID=2942212 RepID=UPI0020BE6DB9|nr:ATP-binding protein [Aquiflexum sp. TKW24L]MCL6257644.1 ATP-binding protein [Aquiflexum sp. TKW24L]